jgi:hypothetical protein
MELSQAGTFILSSLNCCLTLIGSEGWESLETDSGSVRRFRLNEDILSHATNTADKEKIIKVLSAIPAIHNKYRTIAALVTGAPTTNNINTGDFFIFSGVIS